jgi:NAD(P)-dependent dehydrogenase (short-subunit alcohol dehydrogenase family)
MTKKRVVLVTGGSGGAGCRTKQALIAALDASFVVAEKTSTGEVFELTAMNHFDDIRSPPALYTNVKNAHMPKWRGGGNKRRMTRQK